MSQKEAGVVDTPEKKVRTKKEYSAEFIQKTVCDYYRSGTSLAAFCRTTNLPYQTVWDWVSKFTDKYPIMASKEVSKDEQTRALEEENARLRKELSEMTKARDTALFTAHAWETMVDVAEEMFHIPIKKNLAPNGNKHANRFSYNASERYLQVVWLVEQAYYKRDSLALQTRLLQEQIAVDYALSVRKIDPGIGTRKLYTMYCKESACEGKPIGRDHFFRLLQQRQMMLRVHRSIVPKTTDSKHNMPLYPNKVWNVIPLRAN